MSLVDDQARWLQLFAQFQLSADAPARSGTFYKLLAYMTVNAPARLAELHKQGLLDPPLMERLTFQMLHQRYREVLRLRPREEHQNMIDVMTWIMEASPWVFVHGRGVILKSEQEKERNEEI